MLKVQLGQIKLLQQPEAIPGASKDSRRQENGQEESSLGGF